MLTCQKSPFGPPATTRLELMGIRFADLGGDGGGAGDDGDKGDDDKGGDGEKKFTQAEVDALIADRIARDRRERGNQRPKPEPKPKPKDGEDAGGDAQAGISQEDVDKRIQEALAKKDAELAIERAGDAFDKALEGRTFSAAAVRGVDVAQFVKDGKTDAAAIQKWADENTQEGPRPRPRDPGQGGRDGSATSGTTQAGRDLFEKNTKKTDKKE